MKKLTLALAILMLTGSVFAQDGGKSCCKKGGKCSKECAKKDKKSDSKESASAKTTDKKNTTK